MGKSFRGSPYYRETYRSQMGRGKGNPTGWIARVSTGQILFEMDGVTLSNARQAATLVAHKLCLSTKFLCGSRAHCPLRAVVE